MKSNTLRKRPTDVPVQKASEQPGKDLREADKQRQHKEFIAAMNEFIAKGARIQLRSATPAKSSNLS
ncbi:hypothetical protein [Klebsiella pneumoniae]|uniref:hypothetical protein n=1 Tax=Klebsiella pneumoniae TaxID=573 RepID=UPI0012FC7ECB|nr:hypothetical protein [Klebsiella pneumoniae]HBY6121793.1 hypothetical protein [Klebsiella pneumoniae]